MTGLSFAGTGSIGVLPRTGIPRIIDVACRSALVADETISALVDARVYPDRLPTGLAVYPALTYSLVSDIPDPHIVGDSRARVQISCWDRPPAHAGIRSPVVVAEVVEAVIAALNRTALQRRVREWTAAGHAFVISSCRCTGSRRLLEDETGLYHVPCDFEIIYRGG